VVPFSGAGHFPVGIKVDKKQPGKEKFRHWNPPMLKRCGGAHPNW